MADDKFFSWFDLQKILKFEMWEKKSIKGKEKKKTSEAIT